MSISQSKRIQILKDIYTLNISKLPDKYPSPKDLVGKFIIKEYKDFNLLRKSSLPIINIKKIIKSTDVEYYLNDEFVDNIKEEGNSISNQNMNINKDLDEELMYFLNFYNLNDTSKNEDLFDYEPFEDIRKFLIMIKNVLHTYIIIQLIKLYF